MIRPAHRHSVNVVKREFENSFLLLEHNVPRDVIGESLETAEGQKICWPYALNGCVHAQPANLAPEDSTFVPRQDARKTAVCSPQVIQILCRSA